MLRESRHPGNTPFKICLYMVITQTKMICVIIFYTSIMTHCRKTKAKSLRTTEDSILKQLIKEALETIIEDCHHQRLWIHGSKPSTEQKDQKTKKSKMLKSRCRNIRVLFYYAHNLFCWLSFCYCMFSFERITGFVISCYIAVE